MIVNLNRVLFCVMALAVMLGCRKQTSDSVAVVESGHSGRIVAVSYPLAYLVRRIVGDSIEVEFPVDTEDARNWRPDRNAISRMQTADLIIANGTGAAYARWLVTVSLSESKICNTASRGLSLRDYIAVEDVSIVHTHGPEGEHSHPTMVARTWLDPRLAKKQSTYIAEQLKKVYPDRAEELAANLRNLLVDLDGLIALADGVANPEPSPVLLATPKLKFFTRGLGIEDAHLAWDEPPAGNKATADLQRIAASAKRDSDGEAVRPRFILFGDSQPGEDLLRVLAGQGLTAVTLDLIDRKPDTGDFLSAMRTNIEILSRALGAGESASDRGSSDD